jgi:hypothetical protein
VFSERIVLPGCLLSRGRCGQYPGDLLNAPVGFPELAANADGKHGEKKKSERTEEKQEIKGDGHVGLPVALV